MHSILPTMDLPDSHDELERDLVATRDELAQLEDDIGVAGAPKIGDAAAWSSRLERGMASLEMNAINGIASEAGVMPPKGGFAHLSDQEVTAAVAYMVEGSQ